MVPRLGVCSWSLRPSNPSELIERVQAVGVEEIQLALEPIRSGAWSLDETLERLDAAGIGVRSGMMETAGEDYSTLESIRETGGLRSDEHWEANLAAAIECAALADRFGVPLVSLHAGFLPHDPEDPLRQVLLDRLRKVIDAFSEHGIRIALETGQETAETLLEVLDDLNRPIGVNFDPANMILYGMGEPTAALEQLRPHVLQIHVKDATAAATPGTWGAEVPAGDGEVDWPGFFGFVRESSLRCDLMIEREAGDDRIGDIRRARDLVKGLWP